MSEKKSKPTESVGQTTERFKRLTEIFLFAQATGKIDDDKIIENYSAIKHAFAGGQLSEEEESLLEKTFRNIVNLIHPVTYETLRATNTSHGRKFFFDAFGPTFSRARIFLMQLGTVTGIVMSLMLIQAILTVSYRLDPEQNGGYLFWIELFDGLTPFLYGALGACAHLLRTVNDQTHTRTFDPRVIPENWNRLLLGMLSGGVILLFVHQDSGTFAISETALGFIAGYSVDFLFEVIDRMIKAILPNTGLKTAKKAESSLTADHLFVDSLIKKLSGEKDDEMKKCIKGIIEECKKKL